MAVIDFEFNRLKEEIGKDLSLEELETILFDFGLEIDSYDPETDLLKIEVTAERIDLLSFVGFKRALESYLSLKKYTPIKAKESGKQVIVDQSAVNYGNYTVCAVVKNLSLDDQKIKEIINVQEKLHLTYGRKRKSVAIGVYPLDKISFPITFNADFPENIKFVPLGETKEMNGHDIIKCHPTGKEYAHLLESRQRYLFFKDSKDKILSMPPIINSNDVGKVSLDTKDVFLECTGQNLSKLKNTMNILVSMFSDFGGEVYSLEIIYPDHKIISPDTVERKMVVSSKYINQLLGTNLTIKEIISNLEKMMFSCKALEDETVQVSIPIFRTDILHENDIADDVLRGYSIGNITPSYSDVHFNGERLKISIFQEQLITSMVSMGFIEILPFTLSSKKDSFENFNIKGEKYIPLGFSAESSINIVGNWIIPKLFKALTNNQHKAFPQKLFACDFVVVENKSLDILSENRLHLAAVIANSKITFTEISSTLLALVKLIGKDLKLKEKEYPFYIKGRSAAVFIDDMEVGHIGEFLPDVLKNHNYTMPVCGFEIDLFRLV
jgi:phenylalanyl-tRNA synthetase beta chain